MLSNALRPGKSVFKAACIVGLMGYLILLTRLILFKYPDSMINEILRTWSVDNLIRHIHTANFIPLKTISNSLFNPQLRVEVTTLIYNIIAFVPLGMLLPCINENVRKLSVLLIVGLLVSTTFEAVQLATRLGAADVDDVILNVIGTGIGYGCFRLMSLTYRKFLVRQGT